MLNFACFHDFPENWEKNLQEEIVERKNQSKTFTNQEIFTIGAQISFAIYSRREDVGGCGKTSLYTAPEIFQGQSYDRKCEVWSLGMILYELYMKKLPFTNTIINPFVMSQEFTKAQDSGKKGFVCTEKDILNPDDRLFCAVVSRMLLFDRNSRIDIGIAYQALLKLSNVKVKTVNEDFRFNNMIRDLKKPFTDENSLQTRIAQFTTLSSSFPSFSPSSSWSPPSITSMPTSNPTLPPPPTALRSATNTNASMNRSPNANVSLSSMNSFIQSSTQSHPQMEGQTQAQTQAQTHPCIQTQSNYQQVCLQSLPPRQALSNFTQQPQSGYLSQPTIFQQPLQNCQPQQSHDQYFPPQPLPLDCDEANSWVQNPNPNFPKLKKKEKPWDMTTIRPGDIPNNCWSSSCWMSGRMDLGMGKGSGGIGMGMGMNSSGMGMGSGEMGMGIGTTMGGMETVYHTSMDIGGGSGWMSSVGW